MVRKKKTSSDVDFKYSKNKSFENLEAVQKMALNKKGKDDEITPDISIFLKAEELKGKLCGLYSDKDDSSVAVNYMGCVIINGEELKLKVGENIGNKDDTTT
ncbi:hypothetical protein IJD44_02465 [bacterium]|nr:hypothetical protein [bacterium]